MRVHELFCENFEGVWGLAALRQVLTYFQKVSPINRVSFSPPPTAIAEWAIAARRAGEDFVRNQEAGGNSNNGSTAHPTPPEIPLRLRRALSGKPESSTALRMTRAATQKLSLRGIEKGSTLFVLPDEGNNNPCRESF